MKGQVGFEAQVSAHRWEKDAALQAHKGELDPNIDRYFVLGPIQQGQRLKIEGTKKKRNFRIIAFYHPSGQTTCYILNNS